MIGVDANGWFKNFLRVEALRPQTNTRFILTKHTIYNITLSEKIC